MITLCGQILVSRTDDDRPSPPCVHSKRARVYVQNVPVCTGTTRTCVSTCARGVGTYGEVLNLHTGTFSVDTRGFHGATQHTPRRTHTHTPQHKTQDTPQHKTQQQDTTRPQHHTEMERDRDRERQRKKTTREEKTKEDKTRQDETRRDKTRMQDKNAKRRGKMKHKTRKERR